MRGTLFVLASLMAATIAYAGDSESGGAASTTISPFAGAFFPTGTQHRELSRAFLTGARVQYDLPAPVRLIGSIGWTPSRERDFSDVHTNVYQFDTGAELFRRAPAEDRWSISPFIGAGLGGRSYRFKTSSSVSQSDFDGYGSVGGEVDRSRLGARLELRDYMSRFKHIPGDMETSSTRNDLMLTGALTFPL